MQVTGELTGQVLALCRQLVTEVTPATRAKIQPVSDKLNQPLRVAVAGRLKAGKSTLVNALIGRRVAPTAAGECTRLVTEYHYGPTDRVDIVGRDGTTCSMPLDDAGMVPQHLDRPTSHIAYLNVTLASDNLRELTVIDTPGLQSVNDSISEAARAALSHAPLAEDIDDDSQSAAEAAEAIIYVFTQQVRSDDIDALEAFASLTHKLSSSPVNSLALFNKIDHLAPQAGADPWPTADELAREQAQVLRRNVCDVVPLVGLLAETAQAGQLTATDCQHLRTIATLPQTTQQLMCTAVGLFTSLPCDVDVEARTRLLERLDLYGISFALSQLRANPHLATADLLRLLQAASGYPRLQQTLHKSFAQRADIIKASFALSRLSAHAANATDADRDIIRAGIETLLAKPEFHQLKILDAAAAVTTAQVALPEDMEAEVARLALTQDPAQVLAMPGATDRQLRTAALSAASRWRAFANGMATPQQARVAHVAHRGFFLLAQQLNSQQEAAS
ncbi:dynamin family protein [Natronoglycomyces albus]|uniref:Dynamin family protein n=2 Tax=Natronoglycomyces albus TaxID=2811108 RepID=A0A895XWW7_9ACTN|nr:dynamin family protein [Natronoglycomyces albus]